MIATDLQATVESSGILDEQEAHINAEGEPFILDILQNKIYTNKELACIREPASNAFDAHVRAGKPNVPIKVSLPGDLDPVLKIRDYGDGLTHKEVYEYLAGYGASDKRASNDFIGMLGIGAKAPLCYAESFMFNVFQRGERRAYSYNKTPGGKPKMNYMSCDVTNEPDGIEVVIPVEDRHFEKFRLEAENFFKYWKVKPEIEGAEVNLADPEFLYAGADDDWIIPKLPFGARESAVAIMGNVSYKFDDSGLDWTGQDTSLSKLISLGVRMWFNIGELDVAASREYLEMTEKTQNAIFKKLAQIKEQLMLTVNTQMSNAKTMYEAKLLYTEVFDLHSPLYNLRELFSDMITFKGEKVGSNYWNFGGHDNVVSVKRYKPAEGRRTRAFAEYNAQIYANPKIPIILNDLGLETGILSHVAALVEEDKNFLGFKAPYVVFLTVRNGEEWAKLIDEKHFDAPIIPISKVPKVKLKDIYPPGSRGGTNYSNPKHLAEAFIFKKDTTITPFSSRARRRTRDSIHWQITELDFANDEGIYVELEKFCYKGKNGGWNEPDRLYSIQGELNNLIAFPSPLYGIKSSALAEEKPENMQTLWDYIREELTKLAADPITKQQMRNAQAVVDFNGQYGMGYLLEQIVPKLNLANDDCLLELRKAYNLLKLGTDKATKIKTLCDRYGVQVDLNGITPSCDLLPLYNQAKAKYPVLFVTGVHSTFLNYWHSWSGPLQHYVDLVIKNDIKDSIVSDGEGI